MRLNGLLTALMTPIKDDKVDFISYERIIKKQIEAKTDFVVVLGTTGENPTVTNEEYEEMFKFTVDITKGSDTKVIAGSGNNNTKKSIELTKMAQKAGVDGILLVTPYYNKPSQVGLKAHVASVAQETDLPIILYDIPSRSGISIEVDTILSLAKKYKNIVSTKETTGNMKRVYRLRKESSLDIIGASDEDNFTYLASGATGLMSVVANIFPVKTKQLITLVNEGKFKEARELQDEFFELNSVLSVESNPIMIKAAAFELSMIDSLEYRLPMCAPIKSNMKKLEETLKQYERWD